MSDEGWELRARRWASKAKRGGGSQVSQVKWNEIHFHWFFGLLWHLSFWRCAVRTEHVPFWSMKTLRSANAWSQLSACAILPQPVNKTDIEREREWERERDDNQQKISKKKWIKSNKTRKYRARTSLKQLETAWNSLKQLETAWKLGPKSDHGLSQVVGLKSVSANGSARFKEI